jgi:hypothetical protein
MLVIRREIGLVAAICIATYSYQGAWAGIALVAVAFVYDAYLNRGSVRSVAGTAELSGN